MIVDLILPQSEIFLERQPSSASSTTSLASYCCAVLIEFHDITGIHEEDVLFRDAEALCYFCVCF